MKWRLIIYLHTYVHARLLDIKIFSFHIKHKFHLIWYIIRVYYPFYFANVLVCMSYDSILMRSSALTQFHCSWAHRRRHILKRWERLMHEFETNVNESFGKK